jgi:hypothetical protein
MYVIPIFDKTINLLDTTCIRQFWMLLERNGTYCASVDTVEDAVAYATDNDIPLTGEPIVAEPFIFLPVDSKAPALDLFYTWNETRIDEQPMRTVWRPFLWVSENGQDDIWGTNAYLARIIVADTKSVADILATYLAL